MCKMKNVITKGNSEFGERTPSDSRPRMFNGDLLACPSY
jgi:hypothetical protein